MIAFAWFKMRGSERAMLRDLDRKSKRLAEGPLLEAIQRFRGATGVNALTVEVYDVEPINGLAAPDGRIFLTRGLIEKYREGVFTPAEVSAVIAHEIGHLALGHAARRRKAWQVETAAQAAASALLPGMLRGLGGHVGSFAAKVLHMGLSRKDEYQADAYAVALMRRSGLDPAAGASMLEKLERLAEGRGRPVSWLADHPPAAKRIAAIRREIDSVDAAR